MTIVSEAYNQEATYWAQSGIDGYGKRTFSAPVTISVRWEDRTDLVINMGGEKIPSKARVYVLQDMVVGDYLALGDYTSTANPEATAAALRIMQYVKSPSISGNEYTRKAML
jgi:hypothetical protein